MATFLSAFGATIFLVPAGLDLRSFDPSAVPIAGWVAICYYGIFVTVLAFFLWFRGVAIVPASTSAGFMGVLPISAVLLSYAILGESFAWSHLVGIASVLAGIALLTRAAPR